MYFLRFFCIYIADQIALFKGLLPPPNDGGELVFDDDMLHPIQGRLHRLLGQTEDIQQIIFLWVTGYSLPKPDKAKTGDVCVSGLVVGHWTATSTLRRRCELAYCPSRTSSPVQPDEASAASKSLGKQRGYSY